MYRRAVYNYAGQRKLYGRVVVTEAKNTDPIPGISETQYFESLLSTDEEFEFAAGELAADAATKYEKQVLEELLDEIRKST